jgi:SAM-dependent methyltransferase
MSDTFWDQRYATETYVYGTEPNDFVREQGPGIPPGRVLCLAEGEGRNAAYLAGLGHAVTGVDFSREGLRKAAALAASRGVTVELIEADVVAYEPEPGAFAAVISSWLHLSAADRATVYPRAVRALAPGGLFLLEAYTPDQLRYQTGGPRDPALLYRRDDVVGLLDGCELLIARELEREVHEGTFHGGHSAVLQIAARRLPTT